MKLQKLIGLSAVLGAGAAGLSLVPGVQAAPSTHGCIIGDANGTPAPTIYPNSGTSQIGGNTCTITAMSNATDGSGPGYEAASQSWRITGCTPTGTTCTPNPADSYSSGAGSKPVGAPGSLKAGDIITATVSNGTLIVGTFSSS